MWFVCLWGTKEALRKCVSFHMGTAVIQDPVTQALGSGKAFPVGVKLRAKAKCVQKLAASSFKNCTLPQTSYQEELASLHCAGWDKCAEFLTDCMLVLLQVSKCDPPSRCMDLHV